MKIIYKELLINLFSNKKNINNDNICADRYFRPKFTSNK